MVARAIGISIALTPTPSTSMRGTTGAPDGTAAISTSDGRELGAGGAGDGSCADLSFDPFIRPRHPLFQRYPRLPAEHRAQAGVVGVPPAHSLRSRNVPLDDGDARRRRDHVGKLVDRDQSVLPEIERLGMVRSHEAMDALHAV